MKQIELGSKFSRLTVLDYAGSDKHHNQRFVCQCGCGNEKTVNGCDLKSGNTKSCGCLKRDETITRLTTHGMTETPEYLAWRAMINRCYWPKYKAFHRYGGRGISVCARWIDAFENFIEDLGRKPSPTYSLERRDNDGNYEPKNCLWASKTAQANNRVSSRTIELDGRIQTVAQWSRETGIKYTTILARIHLGWHPSRALTP